MRQRQSHAKGPHAQGMHLCERTLYNCTEGTHVLRMKLCNGTPSIAITALDPIQ